MHPILKSSVALFALSLAACASAKATNSPQAMALQDALTKTEAGWTSTTSIISYYDYQLIYTDGGKAEPQKISIKDAAKILSAYDVIFIGEAHRHPGNHLAQMDLFEALYALHPNMALSLEQFETDTQPLIDRYAAGEIGTWPLKKMGRAWDNLTTSYLPLMQFARDRGLPIIAAEAPTDIVTCVGKEGLGYLDRLPTDMRATVARDINLQEGSSYFNKYMKFVRGSSGGHGSTSDTLKTEEEKKQAAERANAAFARVMNSYAAQIVRDDTMAERIYDHVTANSTRKIIHLTGSFHAESFLGTVERVALRNPSLKIAVVSPLQVTDTTHPSFTADDAGNGTILLLTHPVEAEVKDPEMRKQWLASVMQTRGNRNCPY